MILIAVTLAAIAIAGFFASALALWLYGRLFKAEKATFARAAVACLLLTIVGIGVTWGNLANSDRLGDLAVQSLVAVTLVQFFAECLLACFCICWLFRTSFGRAVLIWVCSAVTSAVFAVALAVTVRATCAEAFVVPTGAMSPAIFGMHCYKDCDNCGYQLAVGVSYRLGHAPSQTAITTCTNCGHSVEILPSDATISGDRILANKLAEPERWDLVVFHPPDAPEVMYVKRLVGLPGEEVEILEGDIFINGRRQHKPPGTVPELWLPVHDAAFRPATPPDDEKRCWRSQSDEASWQWDGYQGWQFSGGPGQRGELEFSRPVHDQLAYNADVQRRPSARQQEWQAVRDIKVTCAVSKFRGDGQMGFNWRFGKDKVTARVSAGGDIEIVQLTQGTNGETDPDAKRAPGQLPSPLVVSMLTFAFRDGMAYVMQDDSLIASLTLEDGDAGSQAAEPSQQIAIFAEDCEVALQRIQLFRDVYYLTAEEMMGPYPSSSTPNPIQLSDRQYLFFGDNSRQSKDSRFFGPVAADSVKGVVGCIYWPPERWRRFGSPLVGGGD